MSSNVIVRYFDFLFVDTRLRPPQSDKLLEGIPVFFMFLSSFFIIFKSSDMGKMLEDVFQMSTSSCQPAAAVGSQLLALIAYIANYKGRPNSNSWPPYYTRSFPQW